MNRKTERSWNGKERRRGPDLRVRIGRWMALISAILFLIALMVMHWARPEMKTYFTEFAGLSLRLHWQQQLLYPLLGLLWLCPTIIVTTLIFLRKRTRRQSDNIGVNLALLLIFAILLALYVTYRVFTDF